MSIPKKEDGLGFRDIESFNIALLGKQIWCILQLPNSFSRVLKGRYFATSDILHVDLSTKHTYVWKSLLEGRDLLRKGLRILIGDGKETSIWNDPWLPTHPPQPP